MKNKNIVEIFVLMLLALNFIMPASAQSSIPIELVLIAEPSTIKADETSTITVKLLDENKNPVVTEEDIHVNLSTETGWNSSMIIPIGKNSSSTEFKSNKTGIAIIYAKSKGLISDTVGIAVVETTEAAVATTAPAPGFEAIFAIAGLFTVAYLFRRLRSSGAVKKKR